MPAAVAWNDRVVELRPPGFTSRLERVSEAVSPVEAERVRLTVPVKLFTPASVTVEEPVVPAFKPETELGLAPMEKSGGRTVTVTLANLVG